MKKQFVSKKMESLVKPFELKDYENKVNKKSLRALGLCAISLGLAVVFIGKVAYGLENIFGSISASANFYGTSYLLPFAMGFMAMFFSVLYRLRKN